MVFEKPIINIYKVVSEKVASTTPTGWDDIKRDVYVSEETTPGDVEV